MSLWLSLLLTANVPASLSAYLPFTAHNPAKTKKGPKSQKEPHAHDPKN
jgi:hypothetical protein